MIDYVNTWKSVNQNQPHAEYGMENIYLSNKITNYLNEFKNNIYNEINKKIKIYLDLNLIIDFIKIEKGIKTNRPFIEELYTHIKRLLKEEKAVVLISDMHIFEALKPKSDENFKIMIDMMDILSKGYCISDSSTIEYNEILFCLRLLFSIDNAEYNFKREVYTKPFFLLQNKIFDMSNISALSNKPVEDLQEQFIAYVWEKSLKDIFWSVEQVSRNIFNVKIIEKNICEHLTENRPKYSNEYIDFDDLFKKELFGTFDFYKDIFKDFILRYFESYKVGSNVLSDNLFNKTSEEKFLLIVDSIIKGLTNSKQYNVLPSISIGAGLHSLKRFNENHPYLEGDTFDFYHAKRALPYADYFFTEKTLCGMVKDSRLKFDSIFNCKVMSKLEEAVSELEKI